jgi:CRISPR-associated protein (TIGR02710 family)
MSIDNSTKKLFIATLGTGATGEDIAHAIFFSVNQHNPDAAVFIVSKETKEKTLPFVEEQIKKNKPDLACSIELVDEVIEFDTLHKTYFSIINKYIKQGFRRKNIVADYTSGTKAMSAALVSSAVATEINIISYVYGQRGEDGRVLTGSEKLNLSTTNYFLTQKRINQAMVLFNKYLFDAALELLGTFEETPHPEYQNKIMFIVQLSKALSHWDKFDFNTAYETLNRLMKDDHMLAKAKSMSIGIKKLSQAAVLLKETKLNDFKVFELIANARRRADERKYDDAVARLYRALEMIGQIQFENEFHCSTSDVNPEHIPDNVREEIKNNYLDENDGKIKLPLFVTFHVLNSKGNAYGRLFHARDEEFKKILSKRNNSILAHGTIPLTETDFHKSLQLIEELTSTIEPVIELPKFPKMK